MTDFRGFRAGLEFDFQDYFLEGLEVFLKLSSGVIDILLGTVEHEHLIDIMIPWGWVTVYAPLTEISYFKEGPDIYPRNPFLLMAFSFVSDCVGYEVGGGVSVEYLDVWDTYWVLGVTQAIFLWGFQLDDVLG